MKKYRDFYGATASILVARDGSAVLRVADAHGNRITIKKYASERGARIAMGRIGDEWKEVK